MSRPDCAICVRGFEWSVGFWSPTWINAGVAELVDARASASGPALAKRRAKVAKAPAGSTPASRIHTKRGRVAEAQRPTEPQGDLNP